MELVKIEQRPISGALVPTCDTRDLHEFLEVEKPFATWIKVQIRRARLLENRDFVKVSEVFPRRSKTPTAVAPVANIT